MDQSKVQNMIQEAMQGGSNPLSEAFEQFLTTLMSGTGDQVYDPSVERTGDKVIIPEGASIPDVVSSLRRQHMIEEQITKIHFDLPVSPWDGALALTKAIKKNIGPIIQKDGPFGAHQMDVEVDLGKTVSVPWGYFEISGMENAEVETDYTFRDGRVVFQCNIECKRKYEERVRRLIDTVREIAAQESLHRGKAFSIAFRDENGRPIPLPMPKFFEFLDDEPIFSTEMEEQIERNVFVPIRYAGEMRKMDESLKRGVLFTGKYGVGKTLLASHIARIATAEGWTFIYVKDSKELPAALRFAQQYQPVVVYAEDVDRVAGPERTDDVNDLLNELDGVDSKSAEILTILTSNHPDHINAAMLRPGRVDLVLEVLPPDAETVQRMIIRYCGDALEQNADLTAASQILEGETPARVREAIGRAKLESLRRTGDRTAKITGDDLEAVANEVKAEASLIQSNAKGSGKDHTAQIADGFADVISAVKASMTDGNNGHGEKSRIACA